MSTQDYQCTGWLDGWPTWIGGTGQEWHHCCVAHDRVYDADNVTLMSHIDLGWCVAQSAGPDIINWIMGAAMAGAVTVVWAIKHKNRAGKKDE